ncbi:MAG: hypothetical protein JO275_07470 [Verrucomicrobia bacterium]|nr:hypothetical protein [Verrucomicrobiota bacterium]
MKASTYCFSTILVAASLFTSKAFGVEYSVRGDSGTQCYRLDAPAGYTPNRSHLYDPNGFLYSNPSGNTPNTGILFPINAGMAEVAAVAWAGGKDEIDKSAGIGVSNYPNSLTNIGTKTPGGFYNAAYVHPSHVERVEGPTSYWLVEMTGVVAGEHQKLVAYVLDDGQLVRPEAVPCVETYHREVHHHGKWGGAGTKQWGGAEKKQWGGAEKKQWGGAKPTPTPSQ